MRLLLLSFRDIIDLVKEQGDFELLPLIGRASMTLDEILEDIHALEDELRSYERKYNVLSETFYEAYINGEEPPDESWVRDWTAWASAYKLWLRRREQYQAAIKRLQAEADSIANLIARTARHEPIHIPG